MLETNIWCIRTPQQLERLREDPKGQYCLSADIDMDGAIWNPVDFQGILDGEGHTIRNFHIVTATEQGNQGFFGSLGENARVSNVHLRNVEVVGDPEATHIGVLAGVNMGRIENCSVGADAPYKPTPSGKRRVLTGECDPTVIRDPRKSDVCIGAIAGKNAGVITNVRSYALLETQMQALCGENTGSVDGLWRDCTCRSELLGATAVQMRLDIVRRMEDQGNFRWIPVKDMKFTSAYTTGTSVVYKKNVAHYGLPYTQKYGSIERAASVLDPQGYVMDWMPEYSDKADTDPETPYSGWDVYLGNDCSGAVYWSWCRSCPSATFEYTGHLVPTPENQKEFQILPVGDYTADTEDTIAVIAANTPEKIMECYAQLHMGDAIVCRDPKFGHTRLVMRDPMVIRNADGVIDPDASYVPTHEQGVGKGFTERETTWQLNCRYPFRELVSQFLPITNPDLQRGTPAPVKVWSQDVNGPFSGTVSSNYRIISTTVELIHRSTQQRFESTLFTAVVRKHIDPPQSNDNLARSTVKTVQLAIHRTDLPQLPEGTYDYSVSVRLSNGSTYYVHTGESTL